MKKYLDIKSNGASNQQSTSLRANLNMKPNIKPSTSTSASTSTLARNPGHTRTVSASAASTASQIRNLTTSLTRVSRKEPISIAPAPYIPVRSVPTSRTASEAPTERRRTPTTATGPGPAQEVKGPVRSQASVVSRATTSAAPHRVPMTSGIKSTPATSGPQSLASSGPRRVPMPPPPPAPAKEKPIVALKRPTSRAETAPSSGQRPAVSAAPAKKPVVTITSSLQDRGPPTTKTNKSTIAASSSGSTKPLVINSKPIWGRSAPVPKAATTASKRAVVPSKTLAKKPSSRQISAPTSESSKTRSTTPALIALPPSPVPEHDTDADDIPTLQRPENGLDQNDDQRSGGETPSQPSPLPATDEVKLDKDEVEEVQEQPKASPIPSETIVNPISVNDHSEFESHPDSAATATNECPATPQGALHNPENTNTAMFTAKTPITALLSSIQRGFLYSPSSPLSPADSYLLPGPHGMTTNKDRDAPIQPFNFALHPPSNHTYGKGMETMALGDIGVVKVTDHKLFTPDDGPRQAFVDVNK